MSITTMRVHAVLATAACVLAGAATTAVPAVASAAQHPAAVTAQAAGGTAPACINRTVHNNQEGGMDAYIRNFCGKTMRVKVIVDSWWDSDCHTMKNHTGWLFRTVGGSYHKTVVC
ncbi:hypothetical protein RM550_01985 [Streptomyces sp. DSM 41527]|uniref:Secreted protein n=1 Tax=Streptomyces mooreae TaxID=3075523 RepID=A0ABU2SZU9_9ACTN|nr:hypothetical protein [Streptomyces sp. DSM 41527]MDT0454506.1 hypothetical protein [Streptomyces sp. DSM 41527]